MTVLLDSGRSFVSEHLFRFSVDAYRRQRRTWRR